MRTDGRGADELRPIRIEPGFVRSATGSALIEAGVDTVVLGCTHYPLVRPAIQRCLGRGVEIVTSGEAIVDEVERELAVADVAAPWDRRGNYRFLATGDVDEFRRLGTRFLQLPIARVEHVDVAPGAEVAA